MRSFFYLLVYSVYFLTPFESVAILPGVSVVKLITPIFIFSAILYYKGFPVRDSNFIKLFSIYVIYCIFSTIWSIDYIVTLSNSLGIILPSFILILSLYNAIKTKKHVENIFKAYALGSSFVGIIVIYTWLNGFRFAQNTHDARVTVLGQDQNELSFLLSFGIVSLFYLINFTSLYKKYKILFYAIASLLAFAILTTGSRTGFIILSAIVSILLLMQFKKGRIIYIAPVVLFIGILFFNYLPHSIEKRLLQTSIQLKAHDLTGRGYIWRMGWSAFEQSKAYILGTGFKTFPSLLEQTYGWSKAPHNTYLATLIELGLIGLLIYLSIIFYLINKVFSLVKKGSIFYILFLLPLLLAMFTLGLETRRWLFLIGIIIIKSSQIRYFRLKKSKYDTKNNSVQLKLNQTGTPINY